jgi:hypothetical protein
MSSDNRDNDPVVVFDRVQDRSDRPNLRTSTLTSSPETRLVNTLHNCRTLLAIQMRSARTSGVSSQRLHELRSIPAELPLTIQKLTWQLQALRREQDRQPQVVPLHPDKQDEPTPDC